MAKLKKDKKLLVIAKTVSLPSWYWDIIDEDGSRSKYIKKLLDKSANIKKGRKNEK